MLNSAITTIRLFAFGCIESRSAEPESLVFTTS
jgi:hypothetical protein